MKISGIDHVGTAVKSIREARRLYEDILKLRVSPAIDFPPQNIRMAYVDFPGTRIELLEPAGGGSTIARFLEKRGEGIHHFCLIVDDIEAALVEFKNLGIPLIDSSPRLNPHGDKIAFVHPDGANGVLLELKEKNKDISNASFKTTAGVLKTKGKLTKALIEERERQRDYPGERRRRVTPR